MKYSTLFRRLIANTGEPDNEQSCWLWQGKIKARYARCNIRDNEGKHVEIRPHRAMLVLMEVGGETEHFWQLYKLYSLAELEADHLCWNELCIRPDHLQWLTREEHQARRWPKHG